ncbi:MAG: hypothetical protein ACI8S6_005324 [Myxococcota bacterium]|jgi:hypothetical protein
MDNLMNRFAALQAQIQDLLAGMSPRDRALFLSLVAAAGLSIVVGTIYTMSSRLSTVESRITAREESLGQVRLLIAEYETAKEQSAAIEDELRENSSTDLSAFLDKSAENSQIGGKLDAVKEKTSSTDGVLEEKMYAVSLSDLTEAELAGFLYEIETSGFPLQIKTLKIKSRARGGEKTLRVDMDISAYRLIDEEEG